MGFAKVIIEKHLNEYAQFQQPPNSMDTNGLAQQQRMSQPSRQSNEEQLTQWMQQQIQNAETRGPAFQSLQGGKQAIGSTISGFQNNLRTLTAVAQSTNYSNAPPDYVEYINSLGQQQ